MNEKELQSALKELNLPAIRYYPEVGSTNDMALDWAAEGATEFSLFVAESQSSGRGRLNRAWVTNPGESLAFSLVLQPKANEKISLFSALGGVAVCDSIIQTCHLPATIKWPNDVLINEKKVCGILAETRWENNSPRVVLGIGINVGRGSIPMASQLHFPATSLETEVGRQVKRVTILKDILKSLILWRGLVGNPEFFSYWKTHLAFIDKPVRVTTARQKIEGILKGIDEEGNLQIQEVDGTTINVEMGDVQLRPVL